MTETQECPCGSGITLLKCCQPIIKGKAKAETAEKLLRARYTAFTLGEIDFILASHHSSTKDQIIRKEVEEWSKESKWHGLSVVTVHPEQTEEGKIRQIITFVADYETKGKKQEHSEHALFEKEGSEWKFLDAQSAKNQPIVRAEAKIGRNDPCKCGSGKKSKKCCSKAA